MSRVTVYSRGDCPICDKAKTMLNRWKVEFDEIAIDDNAEAQEKFNTVTNGASTVPQIFIDGNLIGGFDELTELHMDGDLDDLMPKV